MSDFTLDEVTFRSMTSRIGSLTKLARVMKIILRFIFPKCEGKNTDEEVRNILLCSSQKHFLPTSGEGFTNKGRANEIINVTMNLDEQNHLEVFGRTEVAIISVKDERLIIYILTERSWNW